MPLLDVEGTAQVFGGSLPAEMWHQFMAPAVAKLPPLEFAQPSFDENRAIPDGAYG